MWRYLAEILSPTGCINQPRTPRCPTKLLCHGGLPCRELLPPRLTPARLLRTLPARRSRATAFAGPLLYPIASKLCRVIGLLPVAFTERENRVPPTVGILAGCPPRPSPRVLFVGSQELEVATDGTGTCGGAFSCKLLTLLLYRLSLRMRRLAPGWVTGANA